MKIAIVHDWLTNMGGAEQVVINFKELYPEAPIYTTFYTPRKLSDELKNIKVKTSFLQGKREVLNHKKYFVFMPLAFRLFNLNEYDVVLSSSSCCAKSVKTKNGIHICYCHTPMRYAWGKTEDYVKEMGKLKKFAVKILLFFMRKWDKWSSKRVDYFIANSSEVAERIKKYYGRDAVVINPPVRCNKFKISDTNDDYYLVVSRLVTYKRYDLAVKACKEMGRRLIVIGNGPEYENLKKIADNDNNIEFLGEQGTEVVSEYMTKCKALLFPGEEDFGITPVEAMASGRPVIAYGKGGILDSVIDGKTGVLFKEQTVESLKDAMLEFEKMSFNKEEIRKHALEFDESIFKDKIRNFIEEKIKKEKNNEK